MAIGTSALPTLCGSKTWPNETSHCLKRTAATQLVAGGDPHHSGVAVAGVAVFIESHTDMRGTKRENQNLSDRRAKAVTDYIISKGINASQLYAKGFGESRLLNKCSDGIVCSEAEHSINRRTTFRVVNQK